MKYILSLFFLFTLVGCGTPIVADENAPETTLTLPAESVALPTITPIHSASSLPPPASPTAAPIDTPTTIPTHTPTSTVTPTATPTATATPIGLCTERVPTDDLLTIVTLTYGMSRDYAPQDLVLLTDHLPVDITLGFPSELREVALQPLINMLEDMRAEGLSPQILSGYRSYSAQAIAWEKWNREEPARAHILSAPPGHSEHQLGTTVDFGSPELAEIVGNPEIRFHTYFYQTSEGIWLLNNAHKYGFTLSYPLEAFELTGFYYEPWHYRYVGETLATELFNTGLTLTAYQFATQPEPCIP